VIDSAFLRRVDKATAAALGAVAFAASLLTVGLLLALVFVRFFYGGNFLSGHELSLLAAIFLYMCGAVIASRKQGHLTVDFVAQSLKTDRAKAVHATIIAALTLVICVFFLVWSYRMFAWGYQRPQTTPILRLPLWIPQLSILIGAVGCFAYALRDLLAAVFSLRR
jgi:TRAP-type C4-dicarboxylate transport system permease small subunit